MPSLPFKVRTGKLRDATTTIVIHITSADIRGAKPMDPEHCAAARAVKRQYGVKDAVVMRSCSYINMGDTTAPDWVRFHTPPALAREIVAIDRGGRFEPGDYVLVPQPPTRRLGAHKSTGPKKTRRGKKLQHHHRTANIREV